VTSKDLRVDEPLATLGRNLKLPPSLESHRRAIEAALPPIEKVERAA
jgi:glyoxalase family protein